MSNEMIYRVAFFVLFMMLLVMRLHFMIRVRRSGGRILPDDKAIAREGGRGYFIVRVVIFLALIAFLAMYFAGAGWINAFLFPLPAWLRWVGFGIGIAVVFFWTWVQVTLDTQWSPQLQLTQGHHLITSGRMHISGIRFMQACAAGSYLCPSSPPTGSSSGRVF